MGLESKRFFFEFKCSREIIKLIGKGKWRRARGGGGFQLLKMTVHAKICYDFLKLKVSKRFQVDYSKYLRQGARKENIYLYKCLG